MIQTEYGVITEYFITHIELAVSKLSVKEYTAFLNMFDNSRLSEKDIVLALRFLDIDRPITKIDDSQKIKCCKSHADIIEYNDGSGYHMDYGLWTDGELNDLTLSCKFLKAGNGYRVSLLDLHTM